MKKVSVFFLAMFLTTGIFSHTQILTADDDLVLGLKEALDVGIKKAVELVSQVDGYFANEIIKILVPENMQKIASTLASLGLQKQVDEFVLSMNRAAEKAAPVAISIFVDAIKEMSFDDAKGILTGGDTAATEYFKQNTSETIYEAFKPVIASSMEEVGVTRTFKTLTDKYFSLPFIEKKSIDLDHYVTTKALDGLFYMLGEEEKKIRTDPVARVTDILKKVFK